MKKYIIILFFCMGLLSGCSNDFESKKKDLMGSWVCVEYWNQYEDGILNIDFERNLEIEILENGTLEEKSTNSSYQDTFDWYFQLEPQNILLVKNISGFTSTTKAFEITEFSESNMVWNLIEEYENFEKKLIRIEVQRTFER